MGKTVRMRFEDEEATEVDRLLMAIVSLKDLGEAAAFFSDLLTPTEVDELALRLEIARLLADGASYVQVQKATGVSSTTVARVSKCLGGEAGGYRLVLDRLRQDGR